MITLSIAIPTLVVILANLLMWKSLHDVHNGILGICEVAIFCYSIGQFLANAGGSGASGFLSQCLPDLGGVCTGDVADTSNAFISCKFLRSFFIFTEVSLFSNLGHLCRMFYIHVLVYCRKSRSDSWKLCSLSSCVVHYAWAYFCCFGWNVFVQYWSVSLGIFHHLN